MLEAGAVTPLWLRDVSLSPDGSTLLFTYKGDIFTVGANGGKATRLTTTPSYEQMPLWSPDGSQIAFASDRNGGTDIYIMPATGGEATRLTFNSAEELPEAFTPDGKAVVYSAAIQAPAESRVFPSRRLTQLWSVSTTGGRPQRILATPAKNPSFLPDGKSFLYHDVKGMEDEWRKHHTSSVTRDIWRYDAATGRHTNLTSRPGEDRQPVVSPDGSKMFFLSERDGGSFNVYVADLANPSAATALTSFDTHPVRFLSRGANGLLAFTYNGEIYTMPDTGGQPRKVDIDILLDTPDEPVYRSFSSGADEAAVSPNGKEVAFAHRGDIFVTSTDYKTTRQVSDTPAHESTPTWDSDNRTIYYTSDRGGHNNIYRARIGRADDPNFANATLIDETPLFNDGIDRCKPLVSPDGSKMAFVQDRRKIAVMDLNSRAVRLLTNGETITSRDGDMELSWSPDSKWLAATIDVHQRDPYYDIAIIDTDSGEMINLTDDAYMNLNPHWAMDGNAVIFESDRYGMKNHASWGATSDILIAFLNREAYDRFRLSEEDFELSQQLSKNKKAAAKTDTPAKGKGGKKGKKAAKTDDTAAASDAADKAVKVERDGIRDRIVRLTPFSGLVGDSYVDKDGEHLYWTVRGDEGLDLWRTHLRKGDTERYKRLGSSSVSLQPDAEGSYLFLLGPSSMKKMGLSSGKMETISYSARTRLDPEAEREYMYGSMVNEEAERFYRPDMHGVDWTAMSENYRRFLPHISNNADFAEMASELLGELNASHTGARYYGPSAKEATASLGLIYDLAYDGPGLKVAEVIADGPFSFADSRMKPGSVITAVNGSELKADADPLAMLNTLVGKKTLVAFTTPDGAKTEEVVLPIDSYDENSLLYKRWVERNRQAVDSLSGGRLGYVHLSSMSDDSYRTIYADVLGRYFDKEGIVIDTRWNGGGRLHEDIEVLFSGKKYLTQYIKGVKSGEMPSRRWLRPSVMITCEANYSNAHGTPFMYKTCGLGKVVGMPVPGTMTSVNWVEMQDPTLVYGIPVVGFMTAQGNYLENTQLEPDVKVANDPATVVTGTDLQLATAVRTLLSDLDAK